MSKALRDWVDAERGRLDKLSTALGIGSSAVCQWLPPTGKRVPADRMFAVSRITGIPLNKLRPDLVKKKDEAKVADVF